MKAGKAAAEILRREEAKNDLASFIEYIQSPITAWSGLDDWQCILCARLTRMLSEKGQRLLIHAPPQYGKTLCVSHALPAMYLGRDPLARFRELCFNVTHATKQTRSVARIIESQEYRNVFPNTQLPANYADGDWSTLAQLQIPTAQSTAMAMGLGSGTAGSGAGLWIVDDPYGASSDVFSQTINDGVWEWLLADVLARVEEDANVIGVFHRHGQNDLAGRLIARGGWEVISFSSRGGIEGDPMGRYPEEAALSPRKHTLEQLYAKEEEITPSVFAGLYEGRPRPRDGNLYKRAELNGENGRNLIENLPRAIHARCRYWDRAASAKITADETAGVCQSRDERGVFTVESYIGGRWQAFERDEVIVRTAEKDREIFGRDNEPHIKIERQIGQGGAEADTILGRKLAGFSFEFDSATTNKGARNQPFASQVKSGNVQWVKSQGYWQNEKSIEYIFDQLCSFSPDESGKNKGHDDFVDAISGSHNEVAESFLASFG